MCVCASSCTRVCMCVFCVYFLITPLPPPSPPLQVARKLGVPSSKLNFDESGERMHTRKASVCEAPPPPAPPSPPRGSVFVPVALPPPPPAADADWSALQSLVAVCAPSPITPSIRTAGAHWRAGFLNGGAGAGGVGVGVVGVVDVPVGVSVDAQAIASAGVCVSNAVGGVAVCGDKRSRVALEALGNECDDGDDGEVRSFFHNNRQEGTPFRPAILRQVKHPKMPL